jgi:predicted dehydrogenase
MTNDKILIFGYGSIGIKYNKLLKKIYPKKKIFIYSKRNHKIKNHVNNLNDILSLNPKHVFICSSTIDHFKDLIFFEKNFKSINILVEKPLFHKIHSYKFKKNRIFVGYNLRFDPIIKFIKKKIKKKKLWTANIHCGSYLPDWRKNRKYQNTYSSKKNEGGGVVLDLSHEFDYTMWLFGDLEKKFSVVDKISNLKISSEDYCNFYGGAKKCQHINISLNYFSRVSCRTILLNGKDFFLKADLLKKKVEYIDRKKKYSLSLNKLNFEESYLNQIKNFVSLNGKNLCTYKDGMKVLKIINKIK